MRTRPLFTAFMTSAVLLITPAHALPPTVGTAAKPNLDSSVTTAGTSITAGDGSRWAYVVWKSPSLATLNGKAFAVYLQSAPGGGFTRQAIVTPTAEVPALDLLIKRAAMLGADNDELNTVLRDLLRKKIWAGHVGENGIATNLSDFDSKPLDLKLSAVLGRAFQSTDAMSALHIAAPAHPALRLALGRAWAGVLPAGAGPMVVELREWANGTDGTIIGRVQLTPGQGIQIEAPGNVVQVPDLKPSGDLTIKLRWAVPDALRRQQPHIQGFRLYRVLKEDAPGLSPGANAAQIEAFITANPLVIDEVNDGPVPISKLFSNLDVGDFGQFSADRTTYFLADNANRDQPLTDNPNGPRYAGFQANQECYYFVRALDLLGRLGPPSPLGYGIAVRTIPPDIPSGLTATDLPVGPGGERRIVLRWKANGPPTGVLNRTTDSYAVYRGPLPEGATSSLSSLDDPNQFRFSTPIGFVNQSQVDASGYLSFTDDFTTPQPNLTDRSIWYAVTALHHTALDSFAFTPHERVQSDPSPPAFGIFRDRTGPPPPGGTININSGKLVATVRLQNIQTRTSNVTVNNQVYLRVIAARRNKSVQAVKFRFIDNRDHLVKHTSPYMDFGADDSVTYETSLPESVTAGLVMTCQGFSPDGCASIEAQTPPTGFTASETRWQQTSFYVGYYGAAAFAPESGSDVDELGAETSFNTVSVVGPDTMKGTFPLAFPNGATVVIQGRTPGGFGAGGNTLGPIFVTLGVGQVSEGSVFFRHSGRNIGDSQSHEYRAITLPAGGDCMFVHDARPQGLPNLVPITISVTLPPTTREWRIYRRVDDGDLALVKSSPVDPTGLTPEAALAQDKALPPYGAVVSYYAQCFDQNQNPSAFKFLGKVSLYPDPGTPILSPPEAVVGPAGETQMRLKWFCPSPGIQRFRIHALPLKKNDPEAEQITNSSHADFVPKTNLDGGAIVLQAFYLLPGDSQSTSIPETSLFDKPDIQPGDNTDTHQALIKVVPNVPYVVWVSALGIADSNLHAGTAQLFTWKTPPAEPPPEELVAWPARPMPPVTINPNISAFLMSPAINPLLGYLPLFSTVPDQAAANLYPVGIRIGVLPILPDPIEHDPLDPTCAAHPLSFLTNSADNVPSDPEAYLYVDDLLPAALYRQTVLAGNAAGTLVQVSPLRTAIPVKKVPFPTYTPDTRTILRDPFIKGLTYTFGPSVAATILTLVDTHSVEQGATYHYYLVNYRPDGEIRRVFDCGTVTIPEE